MNGTRIIDLSRVLAGPWAVQHLADQGAEVIKVESPTGDETRRFGPVVDGQSTYFLCANRNKRSIALDLKTDAGREVLHRLLQTADVLVENFRPRVAERLGFGWDALHERYPRLVYVAIHAFGRDGDPEWTGRPGYDLALQAMGGAVAMTGFPGSPPLKQANSIADLTAALFAVNAVLHALLDRTRTGLGQRIVVNMMQVQASTLAYHATRYAVTGEVAQQRGNSHFGLVPYDILPCADGWFCVACGNDGIWLRLVQALDLPDKPRWRSNVDRVADRLAVSAVVEAALLPRTLAELDALFSQHGIPGGPVLSPDQTFLHPTVHRVSVDHPIVGAYESVGPVLQTRTTRDEHSPPPPLGGHRDEILAELGLDAAQIAELQARGAFG